MSGARVPEPPRVPVRAMALAIAAAFSLVPIAAGAVWWLYPEARQEPEPDVTPFPAPILEIEPVADYVEYAVEERACLAGAEGRLPIEEAMARIAARGPDAFAPLPPAPEVAP